MKEHSLMNSVFSEFLSQHTPVQSDGDSMKKHKDIIEISASDLSNYLSCHHLTELDLLLTHNHIKAPPFNNPHAETIQQRGFEHEAAYVEHLKKQGLIVKELGQDDGTHLNAYEKTIAAMKEGPDVIVQATLRMGQYFGRADILKKVERSSDLGDFSYEIIDTKLSRETKASSILQLCLYSEMLSLMQGVYPEYMGIVTPGTDFVPETYRLDDFKAYYRLIKSALLKAVDSYNPKSCQTIESTAHYPEPREHCDVCKWFEVCNARRRKDDHLSFVAGLSTSQRKELTEMGIKTLKDLAESTTSLNTESLDRAKEQARMQLEARVTGKPRYEVLDIVPERGLTRLPEPTAGDLFFDLEGDTFFGETGLEYLWGYCFQDQQGKLNYKATWSCDFESEKKAFQDFMQFVLERKKAFPHLKIYHYAPYEPSALKRLMGRYGIMEAELDQLLREEVFVDLYSISRQSIRAGIEKYSIKDLEQFYAYTREASLRDLGPHKRLLEHSLELQSLDRVPKESLDFVELYNKDDCQSTYYLREWLEKLRNEKINAGEEIPRPPIPSGEVNEELSERLRMMNELRDNLQKGLNPVPEQRTLTENAQWLLSELISFYRREDKVNFWEKFRLQELDSTELLEDKAGISGLTFQSKVGGTARCPIERYTFIPQELDIRNGDVYIEGGKKIGTIEKLDIEEGFVDIKKTTAAAGITPQAIWTWSNISTLKKSDRIIEMGQYVLQEKIDNPSMSYKAARDILLHRKPDLTFPPIETEPLKRAKEMALNLNQSYLAIQGPPGTGKSFTASRVILALIEKGYKVGVTALSHKVISNLLDKVVEASKKEKITVNVFQRNNDKENDEITYLKNGDEITSTLQSEASCVVGCTDFAWSTQPRECMDYLVIDEAGQFSLAGLLAIAHTTKNIILLGDGAQLQQPLKGSHPDGCEVSALDYIVDGAKTLPEEKGVFLGTTYRLHPDICAFNSELFYENRLHAVPGNEVQIIQGTTKYAGKAIVIEEVEHQGNSNKSMEEIEKIKLIIEDLLKGTNTFTRMENGVPHTDKITENDIKIIAPYNVQVNLLKHAFPNIKIGTVDKFQGQEAPVVIYSVTTSAPEEAPRGMDFLYSGNRLNVAVSRAQCLFIMVCSPTIFEVDCKSPKQMKLANAYARFREMAK